MQRKVERVKILSLSTTQSFRKLPLRKCFSATLFQQAPFYNCLFATLFLQQNFHNSFSIITVCTLRVCNCNYQKLASAILGHVAGSNISHFNSVKWEPHTSIQLAFEAMVLLWEFYLLYCNYYALVLIKFP